MKRRVLIICVAVLLLLGIIFRGVLIRTYVSLFHKGLETYAIQLLDDEDSLSGRYGLWKTSSSPEDGMVEFRTGGFGLAPSSTYKGFYYSEDNSHKVFSAADEEAVTMVFGQNGAYWSDGTDNHGKSVRITEKWFWYEASF